MNIGKLSRIFSIKYAADLVPVGTNVSEKELLVKNNIAELYRKFMPEFDGVVSQIKAAYDLPFLEEIHTIFSLFIRDIDSLNLEDLSIRTVEFIKFLNKARVLLNDFIKTNKDDPAFVAFFMRKRLASTVEKALTELGASLLKQMSHLKSPVNLGVPSATHMLKDRRRMEQTTKQIEIFVLSFGDLYGVSNLENWGMIKNHDPELAFELMTAFLGLNRASKAYQKSDDYNPKDKRNAQKEKLFLSSKVKPDLRARVLKFLGREG